MRLSTVLFDLGGVVCRFRPERRLMALTPVCSATAQQIQARLWDSGFDAACDRGELTAWEIYSRMQQILGFNTEYEQLGRIWALAFEPEPSVVEIARKLKESYRVGLLTNNGPVLREAMPHAFPELVSTFAPLLFSCEFGAVKPSAGLFEAVVRRIGEPADQILLVDDTLENVRGAQAAGLQAIQFTGVESLAVELARILARPASPGQ